MFAKSNGKLWLQLGNLGFWPLIWNRWDCDRCSVTSENGFGDVGHHAARNRVLGERGCKDTNTCNCPTLLPLESFQASACGGSAEAEQAESLDWGSRAKNLGGPTKVSFKNGPNVNIYRPPKLKDCHFFPSLFNLFQWYFAVGCIRM